MLYEGAYLVAAALAVIALATGRAGLHRDTVSGLEVGYFAADYADTESLEQDLQRYSVEVSLPLWTTPADS